jgi:AcrR family transcriptional regulator
MARESDKEKRDLILNATLKLITANGFDATPMSSIATEAGVAAGTIYLYFKNKEELINELYLEMKARMMNSVTAGYDRTLPVDDSMEFIWKNYVHHIMTKPLEFRFCELFTNSPHINRITKEEGTRLLQPVKELFEKGRREKIIKNLPDEIVTAQLFSPIHNLVKLHLSEQFNLTDKVINTVFKLCWESLKK